MSFQAIPYTKDAFVQLHYGLIQYVTEAVNEQEIDFITEVGQTHLRDKQNLSRIMDNRIDGSLFKIELRPQGLGIVGPLKYVPTYKLQRFRKDYFDALEDTYEIITDELLSDGWTSENVKGIEFIPTDSVVVMNGRAAPEIELMFYEATSLAEQKEQSGDIHSCITFVFLGPGYSGSNSIHIYRYYRPLETTDGITAEWLFDLAKTSDERIKRHVALMGSLLRNGSHGMLRDILTNLEETEREGVTEES